MDLIKILQDSVSKLPQGSHTQGLLAILRHITVAVRHFERESDQHSDRFTDAIYRTNQAYEGSLKEAYRVVARGDPAKKTPHQIEEYFEKNNILRERVLVQIKRYRQDYRNPSTHDHKLDFDQNEALLAITSTCGFAKLLVDQIAERLAFEAAASDPASKIAGSAFSTVDDLALYLAMTAAKSLEEKQSFAFSSELEGFLGGNFAAAGLKVEMDVPNAEGENWDMVVRKGTLMVPIEVRQFGRKFSPDDSHGAGYLEMAMATENLTHGINIVLGKGAGQKFELFKLISRNKGTVFIVTNYKKSDVANIRYFDLTFKSIESIYF